MPDRLTFFQLALVIACSAAVTAQQVERSPYARPVGRAAVEYRDPDIHVVAAYYYSQRNHDSRWLMIEAAVSTTRTLVIERDDIVLRTAEGREIPLATQRRFGQDSARITSLLQNARTSGHDVVSYFVQRDRVDSMRLFTRPFGGVVHNSFVVEDHRVAAGALFFEAPTGRWAEGTYTLLVRHESGAAELPIELE
jgi:hypothetical protein